MNKLLIALSALLLTACTTVNASNGAKVRGRVMIKLPNGEVVDTEYTECSKNAYSDTYWIWTADGTQYCTHATNLVFISQSR